MSTLDWPANMMPSSFDLALQEAGAQSVSPYNGAMMFEDYVASRWLFGVSLPALSMRSRSAEANAREAFFNRLINGKNRVRIGPYLRGQALPAGTMRGTVILSTGASRGDSSISVSGAVSASNSLRYSRTFSNPTWSAINVTGIDGVGTAPDGVSTASRVVEDLTGSAFSHLISQTVTCAAGPNTFSMYCQAGERTKVVLFRAVPAGGFQGRGFDLTAGTSFPATDVGHPSDNPSAWSIQSAGGGWWRCSITFNLPGTSGCGLALVAGSSTQYLGDGVSGAAVWGAQLNTGAQALPFVAAASLLAGDFLGVPGHLLQVASDVAFAESGAGTINLVNRIRSTVASGSTVVWSAPTVEAVLPASAVHAVRRPAVADALQVDLMEAL